jgi:hypothetical protein
MRYLTVSLRTAKLPRKTSTNRQDAKAQRNSAANGFRVLVGHPWRLGALAVQIDLCVLAAKN